MYVTPFIIMFVHFIFNKCINLFDFLFLFNFNLKMLRTVLCQSIYNSEYNFLPQGIKMEQFFARSFHLKKYLKLFLLGLIQKLLNLKLMKARY